MGKNSSQECFDANPVLWRWQEMWLLCLPALISPDANGYVIRISLGLLASYRMLHAGLGENADFPFRALLNSPSVSSAHKFILCRASKMPCLLWDSACLSLLCSQKSMKQERMISYYIKSTMEQVKWLIPLAEEELNLDPVTIFSRWIKLGS